MNYRYCTESTQENFDFDVDAKGIKQLTGSEFEAAPALDPEGIAL